MSIMVGRITTKFVTILAVLAFVDGHGAMTYPRPRNALDGDLPAFTSWAFPCDATHKGVNCTMTFCGDAKNCQVCPSRRVCLTNSLALCLSLTRYVPFSLLTVPFSHAVRFCPSPFVWLSQFCVVVRDLVQSQHTTGARTRSQQTTVKPVTGEAPACACT